MEPLGAYHADRQLGYSRLSLRSSILVWRSRGKIIFFCRSVPTWKKSKI